MLQGENSAILSTFIKLPVVIQTFVLSIFEWPFYTGFTVIKISKYGKCFKILNTFLFLFSNKMLVFRAGIHKTLVRYHKQTGKTLTRLPLLLQKQSDLGLQCLSRPFGQAKNV